MGLHVNDQQKCESLLMAIVGAEYVLNMLPKGTHEYAKFIRPSELIGFCNSKSSLRRCRSPAHQATL